MPVHSPSSFIFRPELPEIQAKCLGCHQTEKKMHESGQRLLRQPGDRDYTPPIADALRVRRSTPESLALKTRLGPGASPSPVEPLFDN